MNATDAGSTIVHRISF